MSFLTLAMAGYAVSELEIVRVRSYFAFELYKHVGPEGFI